jgi:hypothetical protein
MDARRETTFEITELSRPDPVSGRAAVALGRGAESNRARCPPRVAQSRCVQTLRLEQPRGRRQMLLALPDPATPRQGVQQQFMDVRLERRDLQPSLQGGDCLAIRNVGCQPLEQRRVMGAEPAPLGGEPAVEARAAVDLQPLAELPREHGDLRPEPLHRDAGDPLPHRMAEFDRIDDATGKVEPDVVVAGLHAPTAGFVHHTPDLAQTPPKLSPRIVRNIPE